MYYKVLKNALSKDIKFKEIIMNNFILNDNLFHKAYSWPKTVLSYRFKGNAPMRGADVLLMDNQPICYQAEQENDHYILRVLADLQTGAKHEFVWEKGNEIIYSELDTGMNNGAIRIEDIDGGLFRLFHINGIQYVYSLKTNKKLLSEIKKIEGGAIEKTLKKELSFEDGASYSIIIKLKKDLDYVEIYEKMFGFKQGEAFLEITWKNFYPSHRYTLDRKEEKIDAYLKKGGILPFVINPYMPRVSIWDQRYVAYIDKEKECWTGLLLHDLEYYDDGKYAIWGSNYALAFILKPEKWIAPITEGKRAFMNVFCVDKTPETLGTLYLRYYSLMHLDKVKDWVLDWEDNKNEYPKYFRVDNNKLADYWHFQRKGTPTPSDMIDIIDKYSNTFYKLEQIEPVHCREFIYEWVPVFDMTASRLNDEEFKRVRAAMAFICYVLSSEDYCPIDNMLAGHPNFLTDIMGALGAIAAIFGEKHPLYKKWLARYEVALARNMKYHIRPAVDKWNAMGGRWTENVGCYMFAALHAMVFVCSLIYHTGKGEVPILYPNFTKLLAFLIDMQSVENEQGRRLYLPQGAHSCTGEFGGELGHGYFLTMIQLADLCRDFAPIESEYILHNYRDQNNFIAAINQAPAFESGSYIQKTMNNGGTAPNLISKKYTGLGFILRHSANSKDEMFVCLQQIDEGPNYRWGRAAQGGCGEIHYYANGKKYTDHAPEDVGDENRGDVQSCTNFGVLVGHEFKSVGRNDLTEPLMDFDFIQYARINAGEYSSPYYNYRSVMMVENKYIVVYDSVRDACQYGRFSWTQNQKDEFPCIWNVKPGIESRFVNTGDPIDSVAPYYVPNKTDTRVLAFEGKGDFLTTISHIKDIEKPQKTEYGCDIKVANRIDRVFNDNARVVFQDDVIAFDGYVGYCSKVDKEIRLAIFDGKMIACEGYSITLLNGNSIRCGMSMSVKEDSLYGKAFFEEIGTVCIKTYLAYKRYVWIDGIKVYSEYNDGMYTFSMPKGNHTWSIGLMPKIKQAKINNVVSNKDGFSCFFENIEIDNYEIQVSADGENTWKTVGITPNMFFNLDNLACGKYHVRVRGLRGVEKGEFSNSYPVYITNQKPHCPTGLRITQLQNRKYEITWGQVLGCSQYHLYLRQKDKYVLVYEGEMRRFISSYEGSYYVTAVNGNGESEASISRDTSDILTRWDNHQEKGFIRDTRSHERGYPGFDYINNPLCVSLSYPGNDVIDVETVE